VYETRPGGAGWKRGEDIVKTRPNGRGKGNQTWVHDKTRARKGKGGGKDPRIKGHLLLIGRSSQGSLGCWASGRRVQHVNYSQGLTQERE